MLITSPPSLIIYFNVIRDSYPVTSGTFIISDKVRLIRSVASTMYSNVVAWMATSVVATVSSVVVELLSRSSG